MNFAHLEKLTLIDYPGKLAALAFTQGCNLRCRFCHNPDIVLCNNTAFSTVLGEAVLTFLKTRIGKLEGFAVTGGEPLLHGMNLLNFLHKVKKMGFSIKVDTDGGIPKMLEVFIKSGIVDYWAMDVKTSLIKYSQITQTDISSTKFAKSIELIKNSGVDYEFRTTFLKGHHTKSEFADISKLVEGAKNYYIQNFRPGNTIDDILNETNSFSIKELEDIKSYFAGKVDHVEIRW